jgi:hypothetical protein
MHGLNEQELQVMNECSNGDCSRSPGRTWEDDGLYDVFISLRSRGLVVSHVPCPNPDCPGGKHSHHTAMGKLVLQYHLLSVQSFDF